MIAGIGLHRIHLQHILLRRSPEDIQLGTLVRIMVDGSAAVVARISPLGMKRRPLHAALHVAQDAQLVLLAQYAHDALSAAIGVAEETCSSAHSVLTLAQGDVNHLFQTAAALHHFSILANLDGFYFSRLEMMEQGSVIQSVFLVVDTDYEFSI